MLLGCRLNLALLKLIDDGEVGQMLDRIRNSADFYEQVLVDLIASEITDTEKNFQLFSATFKHAVKSAVTAALSVESGRAKKFINELNLQCLTLFKDNYLAMNLITDSDGYENCDNEEDDVFREKCLKLSEEATSNRMPLRDEKWEEALSRQVIKYMRNVRREDVARPRCIAACPRCDSLCIHPANHDTSAVKHDTYHQPEGIVGNCWAKIKGFEKSNSLIHETCAMHFECNNFFYFFDKKKRFKNFDKVYPEWMNPKMLERLPHREYIFAVYQEDIAKKYYKKECLDIPLDYYHDLGKLRQDLEKAANLSQDK